jgi:glycosyltransferase involved in cell wall biosynthesis
MMLLLASRNGSSDLLHGTKQSLKVLVFSRNYPNNVIKILGLWVEGLVRHLTKLCEPKVIAPVPYCPPLPGQSQFTRFRAIERQRWADGIEVFHPRFLVGPGHSLHQLESTMYYLAVRRLVGRLRERFPFDLIHAHFAYPDGVVAARIARRYGVPVIITEQVPWRPWMDDSPFVRRQSLRAISESTFQIAISRSVRDSMTHFTGELPNLQIIPDGVDGSIFRRPPESLPLLPNQILFVGVTRPVKGVDILLRAIRLLVDRGSPVRLLLVGGCFYQQYRREYDRLVQMAQDLGLTNHVHFGGEKSFPELVRHMQESALLVLPSRIESFGAVLVEALACGTPVVATRCGGPEDIVTEEVGVLVPPENPAALAAAIERVLSQRARYDPAKLRAYALERFSWDRIARDIFHLYQQAIPRHQRPASVPLETCTANLS